MSEDIKSQLQTGLADIKSHLDAKLAEHTAEIEKHGKSSTALTGQIDELSESLKSIQDEITDLAQKSLNHSNQEQSKKSIGMQFSEHDGFKSVAAGQVDRVRFDVKNTVTAVAGTTTFDMQRQGVVPGDFAPLTIRQLIPTIGVSSNAVTSMRELAWTNNAAETAQAAAKPESDLTFEQYTVPVQTVAHWIKVSNQLLADAPAIAAYIDTRLRDGLAQRIDAQLLNGNGTAPNLSGMTNAGNFTAYTPASGDNLAESINKAKYQLWAAGNAPDVVIVNPADWSKLELLKTTDGAYLYGPPGTIANAMPFGVRVVMSNNMAAGKFLIGNLRGSTTLFDRQTTTVEMGYVNDDFTKNLVTIRAEERLGLAVDRPSGILYGDITAA